LNNLGEVVGSASSYTATRAVLWTGGAIVDLNDRLAPDSGWELRSANDINDQGTVVGWGYHDSVARAYSLNGSSITDLGTLGGNTSSAAAISNVGVVVGSAEDGLGQARACLWWDGQITNLGVDGGTFSTASDVNDDNVVVGRFGELNPGGHVDSHSSGSTDKQLIGFDGAIWTGASAINNAEQIIGHGGKSTPSFWYNVAIL
jgi:probable HAF family extracellular repeat protein